MTKQGSSSPVLQTDTLTKNKCVQPEAEDNENQPDSVAAHAFLFASLPICVRSTLSVQLVEEFEGGAKDFAWIGTETYMTYFTHRCDILWTARCRPADLTFYPRFSQRRVRASMQKPTRKMRKDAAESSLSFANVLAHC